MVQSSSQRNNVTGAPNFAIPLKKNARYMIIKNYAPGCINGTICKLIAFSREIVHVQLLTGTRQRSIVMLPRCTFHILPGDDTKSNAHNL